MVGARPESMLAMLEMVERKWGGAEGYVKTACGLTDEEIGKVRRILVRTNVVRTERRKSRVWETSKEILNRLRNAFGGK